MARHRLKTIDVAFPWLSRLQRVLSQFPNLESLSIQKTLRSCDMNPWGPLVFLMKLQIYKSEGILASDIPDLVSLFPSLRILMLSKITSIGPELFHVRHQEGWHLLPNALCNTHQQLDSIHVDHLSYQQIQFIGLVPTRTLITTSIDPPQLLLALTVDLHFFLGMKTLQRGNWVPYESKGPNSASRIFSLNEWCAARGVKVVEGGEPVHDCTCCYKT